MTKPKGINRPSIERKADPSGPKPVDIEQRFRETPLVPVQDPASRPDPNPGIRRANSAKKSTAK